jgi:hypothetical protein
MSTLKVNTLEEATAGGATFFTAKSWVNLNGTGTVSIRADGNVSSITDNGTGVYSVNLSNPHTDANAAVTSDAGDLSTSRNASTNSLAAPTSSTFRVISFTATGSGAVDSEYISVSSVR